jgi:hypothetical protein
MGTLGLEEKDLSPGGLVAFIFSFIVVELYFVSPIYFIIKYNNKYIKKKHLPIIQIFANLLNCATYVIIAIKGTGDFQNFLTNIIGVILCIIVVLELWLSLYKRKSSNYLLPFFLISNIIFQIYYYIFKINKDGEKNKNELIFQILPIIINICMYLSLNIGVYFGFKEKRADRIPLLSAILGLLSSIGWTIYSSFDNNEIVDNNNNNEDGKNKSDIITRISNGISIIILIVPIVSYIYLSKKYQMNQNMDNTVTEDSEKKKIDLENKALDEQEGNDD